MLWFNTEFSLVNDKSNKYFIFDKKNENKEYINEDMFELISEISRMHQIDGLIQSHLSNLGVFEIFLEKKLLVERETIYMDSVFIQDCSNIDRIFLEVSQKCNLKCKHCYNESSFTMDDALSFEEISNLINSAKNAGCYIFQLTGGEPLIRKDIVDIINLIGRQGFKTTIFTNLTYLNKELIELIVKFNIKIVTSIDFIDSEKHDEFRGKSGALKRTIKNIKLLKKKSIDIRVNMMIDGKTDKELEEIVNYLKFELEVSYIADVIIPTGRGGNNIKADYLFEMSKKYKEIAIDSVINNSRLNLARTLDCDSNCIYSNDCGVGKNFLFFDSFGNAIICPSMRKDESLLFWYGNVKNDSFKTIISNFQNKKLLLECMYKNECVFSKQCLGGCRSRAYHFLGDIQAVDPIMCSIYQDKNSDMMRWRNEVL